MPDFLAAYGLLAVFLIILVKEMGLPVPIPSDLLLFGAGAQAATGMYELPSLFLAIVVATLLGASAQFLFIRGAGRKLVYRFGPRVGLSARRLDEGATALRRRGILALFLGLNTPGARAGLIAAAGVADMKYAHFLPGLLTGAGFFCAWHLALGYVAGPAVAEWLGSTPLVIPLVITALAAVGLVVWLALRRRGVSGDTTREQLLAWTEAACPACLAINVVQTVTAVHVHEAGAG